MPLSPAHLLAEGLRQRFGRRELFRDLALAVGPGEALAVTGANGAGKSTLLQILAGLRTPTAGRVHLQVNGAAIPHEARPLAVGFVAPYLQVYDDLTAEENLAFLAQARRLSGGEDRVRGVLARVGLAGREGDRLKTFSSGMRQRVRFATALLAEPSVLLLDEPGSNLDAEGRALVERVVREQREAGGLVVLATNAEEEAALCERRVEIGRV
jgi:heme exporter protein A